MMWILLLFCFLTMEASDEASTAFEASRGAPMRPLVVEETGNEFEELMKKLESCTITPRTFVDFVIKMVSALIDEQTTEAVKAVGLEERHFPQICMLLVMMQGKSIPEIANFVLPYLEKAENRFKDVKKCENIGKLPKQDQALAVMFQVLMGDRGVGFREDTVNNMIPEIHRFLGKEVSSENLRKSFAKMGVYLYTAEREKGGIYRDINKATQFDQVLKVQNEMGFVLSGFRVLYTRYYDEFKPDYSKPLYRGMGGAGMSNDQFAQFKKGQIFRFPSFMSTTYDEEVAKKFARVDFDKDTVPGPESVIFMFHIGPQTPAIEVQSVSALPDEKEVLIEPYAAFKVVDVKSTSFAGRGLIEMQWFNNDFDEPKQKRRK